MASIAFFTAPSAAPLARLVGTSLAARGIAILIGSLILALSAQITVPMVPVPMTMQTYAVLIVAALGGRVIGVGAIVAYLLEGLMNAPVFAGGAFGWVAFSGPTGGFLVGFLVMGWLAAEGVERGYTRSLTGAIAVLTAAHLSVFLPGVAWLSGFVGFEKALALGFVPFIAGTVLKTALAVATLRGGERALAKRA